jgi:hypothetical protein
MVYEAAQYKMTYFHLSEQGMIEPTCKKLFKINENNPVKYIRCNDGGENKGLQNKLEGAEWKLPIKLEFTGRTPTKKSFSISFKTYFGERLFKLQPTLMA